MSDDKSDKGKSILGAPPKVGKKETKQKIIAPPTRSLNQRSLTSVTTVEHLSTLIQIAING